ncbi:MAG: site-2 protease family protein [Acidobacteriota bacterium]
MEMQEMIALGLLWYTAFLLSTTCHEAAHALIAKWGGDLTAYAGGQVSLNPVPHIQREPFGMVMMPWLSFLLGGGSWMMGWASAPYDPYWARRHPRRSGWMALGGPVANFILVIVAGLVIQAGLRSGTFLLPGSLSMSHLVEANGGVAAGFATFFSILFSLNLLLGTFNLIPFPPLDGFAVLNIIVPESGAQKLMDLRDSLGPYMMLGLLVAWKVFDYLYTPIFSVALHILYPGEVFGR